MIGLGRLLAGAVAALLIDVTPPRPLESSRPERDGPRRIALLIGIADYQHFVDGGPPGQSDLRGPVNDVMRMRTSLVGYGFDDPENVRILTNGAASRAGIEAGIAWARSRVRDSTDVVVIYFSGHGSQVRDLDGDEALLDSADVFDEALVPSDARDATAPDQVIVDDDLGRWLDGIGTPRLTVIIDACFSGTVTRDMGLAIPKGAVSTAADAAPPSYERRDAAQIESRYPVITAAGPYETAVELPWADLGGRYAGVMTYHLTRLMDASVGTGLRIDELLPLLRRDMLRHAHHSAGVDGDSAARARVLFDAEPAFARRAFYTVTPDGDGFIVNAGAVHGLRVGTTLDVYAPEDPQMREASPATVIVASVDDTASLATVVDSRGRRIQPGSRAVPSRMPPGLQVMTTLAVHVPAAATELRRMVQSVPFAELSDSASATVHLQPGRQGVRITVDGDVLIPLVPGGPQGSTPSQWLTPAAPGTAAASVFPGTSEALCTALRRAFVARSLGSVVNPTRPANVGLELRVVKSGVDPTKLPPSTVDTLYEGERYDFMVLATGTGRAQRFLSIAFAGYSGQPLVLWPSGGKAQQPFPEVNRGWFTFLEAPVGPPYGAERLVAYFGNHDYSLAPLVERAPECAAAPTARTRDIGEEDPHLSGWTSVERRILILPPR